MRKDHFWPALGFASLALACGREEPSGEASGPYRESHPAQLHAQGRVAMGDVNGSGTVDINDALLLARYAAGMSPQPFDVEVADADCNGKIDILDARRVAEFASGLLPSLACETLPARGPVKVQRGTVVTYDGTPLRGAKWSLDRWHRDRELPSPTDYAHLKELGMNAVHVYANHNEGTYAPQFNLDRVEEMARATGAQGLYLVVTPSVSCWKDASPQCARGTASYQWLADFWTAYATRLADYPHVLFEIDNEPEVRADHLQHPYDASTLDMQADMFALIRQRAPHRHVMLLSQALLRDNAATAANVAGLLDRVARIGSPIAWANESVSFHSYESSAPWTTQGPTQLMEAAKQLMDQGIPVLCTELEFRAGTNTFWPWSVVVNHIWAHEKYGVSWLGFNGLAPAADGTPVGDLHNYDNFQFQIEEAGISWTPDEGTWPGTLPSRIEIAAATGEYDTATNASGGVDQFQPQYSFDLNPRCGSRWQRTDPSAPPSITYDLGSQQSISRIHLLPCRSECCGSALTEPLIFEFGNPGPDGTIVYRGSLGIALASDVDARDYLHIDLGTPVQARYVRAHGTRPGKLAILDVVFLRPGSITPGYPGWQ